jgi:hypothetical protein
VGTLRETLADRATRRIVPGVLALLIAAIPLAALRATGAATGRARAEAELRYQGEIADDNFGWSLASAGDMNRDGLVELIVGAIFNDDAGSAAGKTYVLPGDRSFDTTPLVTMVGEAPHDHFGVSVDGAGDVNGDGIDDVLVGARFNDRVASAAGAAFLFLGGAPADGVPDLIVTGEFKDDWFGQSVALAGDVNGDGFDDLLVGAPFSDDLGSAAGKAYLYFGGQLLDGTPDLILYGDPQEDAHFGWSVAGAGDVNGDGHDDLVVGARLYGTGLERARGRAYVFFGGERPDAVPDLVLTGEFMDDWFGQAVGSAGDVNGDDYDDVLVGAPFFDLVLGTEVRSAVGRVYVFFGGPAADALPDRVVTGEDPDEQVGWTLGGLGDIDRDGFDDLLVPGHFYDDGLTLAAGRVIVAYGGSGPDLRPGPRIVGLAQDDQFGHDIAILAPGAGDRFGSLAVSAVYNDVAGSGAGQVSRFSLICLWLALEGDAVGVAPCRDFESVSLYRGRVADLRAGDGGACLARLQAPANALTDAESPLAGEAFFYNALGDAAGLEGHPGFRSDGASRPLPASCP